MNAKRKSGDFKGAIHSRPAKRSRQENGNGSSDKPKLSFTPRPDWHAAELPPLVQHDAKSLPPAHTIDEVHRYATTLLKAENASYDSSHLAGSSSHKFLSTVMSSGTLEDKVSALTLLVQESPLHTKKAFENLLGLAKKKSRNQALMAVAALKDLLSQGVVLPSDRKLRAFSKQPDLLSAFQGKASKWTARDPLPSGVEKIHLIVWAYEDWLKKMYFELLQILETWCNDEVEYARSRAVTYVWELLRDKPEQEENLLRLLVNKLGDKGRKIASRTSYLLLQLENSHPAMKLIITNSIESDCLFRPGQSLHAKYYAIITLNQTILTAKEPELSNRLLDVYFSLFVQLLKPLDNAVKTEKSTKPAVINGRQQGGGGKAGKMAAKKQKAQERVAEAAIELNDKMIAAVLTGVNRAFPFADTSDPTFEKQLDTIFRVAHSANFNTAVQALVLLQQISSAKHYGAERYYRTLYESLLDPRLFHSSKQVMYLNLLYKSLKSDLNAKRVQAFVKRLLQTITLHEPPFACGVLYLITELQTSFPSIQHMLTEPEASADDDGEEHFVDAPEDADPTSPALPDPSSLSTSQSLYDPKKRDPIHSNADRSCLWDLLPLLPHFHPSVALFAQHVASATPLADKPDVSQHALMPFLDRFVYRSPRSKPAPSRGGSIMQPLAANGSAADVLVRPRMAETGPKASSTPGSALNSEAFWTRKVENVPVQEVFFHSYFNAGAQKRKGRGERRREDGKDADADEDEEGQEEEIWKAIANSRPEVEGEDDEDDDLSMGDLESAYDKSDEDDGSEMGIDLGGEGEDGGEFRFGDEDEDMESLPELDSGDDALLDDEDDVPVEMDAESSAAEEEEEAVSRNKKKRQERKKLKQLPTFASAEDYAKLLDDEPDDV